MQKLVAIDYLAESVKRYRPGWAIVAVDVIRATTTAITAVSKGRRCFPAPTIEAALVQAREFSDPLLAGEAGGHIPPGFEIDNSPAQVAGRTDTHRPLVLVSSSGTKVIHEAAGSDAIYLSCFRDYSFLANYLSGRHDKVAIIGAGSLGEFREEDQACCAWIAAELLRQGYSSQNSETAKLASRWCDQLPEACLGSRSVAFLKRTNRLADLEFIFSHIDDLRAVFALRNGEVRMVYQEPSARRVGETNKRNEQPAAVVADC